MPSPPHHPRQEGPGVSPLSARVCLPAPGPSASGFQPLGPAAGLRGSGPRVVPPGCPRGPGLPRPRPRGPGQCSRGRRACGLSRLTLRALLLSWPLCQALEIQSRYNSDVLLQDYFCFILFYFNFSAIHCI